MTFQRLVPAILRLTTLGLRFILIFLLARFLPAADVGLYGVFTATVSYLLYPLGFDFYTYATRQVMRSDPANRRIFIVSQFAFATCVFLILTPVLFGLFWVGLLPWHLAGWFFVLLPLEYLSFEIDRLLIAMSDQFGASVALFIGGSLSPLTAIPLLVRSPQLRHLSTVLGTWTAYDVLAILIGAALLSRRTRGATPPRVDWTWIRRGIRASVPFLAGTVCLRALFTVDRQIVKAFTDLSALGAYTFYMSIGAGVTSVLYSGLQQFAYPRLVRAAHQRDSATFHRILRGLLIQTLGAFLGLCVVALAGQPLLLRIVGGGVYRDYAWILPVALLAVGIYNLSMVPHYALYALDGDSAILRSTVTALLVFIVITAAFAHHNAIKAVLAAITAASTVLAVSKYALYRSVVKARA